MKKLIQNGLKTTVVIAMLATPFSVKQSYADGGSGVGLSLLIWTTAGILLHQDKIAVNHIDEIKLECYQFQITGTVGPNLSDYLGKIKTSMPEKDDDQLVNDLLDALERS